MGFLRFSFTLKDRGLINRLETVNDFRAAQEQSRMLTEIMDESIDILRNYPPETEANRPPPPYYQRGVGYFGRYGKLTKPSENLRNQWDSEVFITDKGAEGTLFNLASYSGYVHDTELQPSWHRMRGWQTVQSVVGEVSGDRESQEQPLARAVRKTSNFLSDTVHRIANFIRG